MTVAAKRIVEAAGLNDSRINARLRQLNPDWHQHAGPWTVAEETRGHADMLRVVARFFLDEADRIDRGYQPR